MSLKRVSKQEYGKYYNPETKATNMVYLYTLTNKNRMSVQILSYGATIYSVKVPNKCCELIDVCLGFESLRGYQSDMNPYFGATIGRVGNTIGKSKFVLDGHEYQVSRNHLNKHMIHGGFFGLDKMLWYEESLRNDGLSLRCIQADGHEGFPGQLTVTLHLKLTDDNCFQLHYEATTTKRTPVSICNRTFFNLAGHKAGKKAMYEHYVMIKADCLTEKDREQIPTGQYKKLEGTPYDCCKWSNIGNGIVSMAPAMGYDDNYCLTLEDNPHALPVKFYKEHCIDQDDGKMTLVARAWHPGSGILMEIVSDQLSVHFYTSHHMPDVSCGARPTIFGKENALYEKHGSFCMSTCGLPDAVNHQEFPSIILSPGEKYCHRCFFNFSIMTQRC